MSLRLQGENVVLRSVASGDLEPLAVIAAQPGVARWWGPLDKDELRGPAAATSLAVESGGEVIGLIQFHEENEPDFRHAGIDIFLSEGVHGRGFGTDAVRTLAAHLIHERGHHRLTVDPAAANTVAIRVYEKVGFRPVGVLREYWRSPEGIWSDGLLMDLLAPELLAESGRA